VLGYLRGSDPLCDLRAGASLPRTRDEESGSRESFALHGTGKGLAALSRSEEAALNKVRRFGARPSSAGWAPYVMISAGFGAGALLLAIALFLKLA
jgi:hypothetical protein